MPKFLLLIEGIPIEILDGIFDHTEEHPADNGIQFEPINQTEKLKEPQQ